MSHSLTILLYIFIISCSTALAFSSQSIQTVNQKNVVKKFRKTPFILSGLIAWFFLAFTNIGVDYPNYYYIIEQESWGTFGSIATVEPGFGLLCVVIKQLISPDADVVILILKTIIIVLMFFSFYSLREKIVLGYAVAAFMLLAYLPSFYLISMMLATAIIYFCIACYIKNDKILLPLLLTILAAQIHNSAYLFLIVLIALFMLERIAQLTTLTKAGIVAAYSIAIIFSGKIYSFAGKVINGFHYSHYGNNDFSGSGLMVVVLYAPLALILYEIYKYNISSKQKNYLFVFVLSSLLFNILSYRFKVIERMEFYFLPLYILFIPNVLLDTNIIKFNRNNRYKSLVWIIYICYLLLRGFLVFKERTSIGSGMSEYSFFNPFL